MIVTGFVFSRFLPKVTHDNDLYTIRYIYKKVYTIIPHSTEIFQAVYLRP